jgi:hypothetical protein
MELIMGRRLTVYMIDGTENGPRTVEIGNWSGKAIYSPRAKLFELLKRDEFSKPGIYILKSDPQSSNCDERVYFGEAERVGNRLKQHLNNPDKDFKECVIFITKDEMFTKSSIKYIESRLISIATSAQNAEIENANAPTESTLSEAEISDMEYYIEQIKLILPINGFFCLIPNTITSENKKKLEEEKLINQKYYINSKGVAASLIETSEGFIVLKDSFACKVTSRSIMESWLKLRQKLINAGTLVPDNDKLRFTSDTIFTSPSAASSIVLGRQSSGPLEWKTENGISLKEINED